MKIVKNKYLTLGIVFLFSLCYFTPLIFVAPNSNKADIQEESLPKNTALTQTLLHSYDFEGDTVGQDPSGVTLSVIEPAGSGTANVDNLGDAQQNHVAVHKDGGDQRVELRDNISYYGNTFDAGVFHCKIYHDDSLFGILFHDDIGVLFRLDWFDGIIGRWNPYAVYTTYNYNQWYDVVVYFNISLGWMFEIDGVRFGDGYAYPFEHTGSGGMEWIRWCSAFSGGGNGFFRVDDVEFYYYEQVTSFFFDDFESGLSKWQSITGLWHLTDTGSVWPDPCHSPTHAMWFGDESTGTYETGSQEFGELVSIPFSLVGFDLASLEFYHWRAGEGGSYDVSYVYISIDGINWDLLYQSSSFYIAPWEQVSLDISGYVGNPSVQLMFYFDTLDDIGNAYRGWLVDDIQVIGITLDHDLSVSLDTPMNPQIGNSYLINATVTNNGANDETNVDLFLYLDEVIVDSVTISSLPVGVSETINYMWTPIDYETYNFTAYAPPVPGETITGNNFVTEIINIAFGGVILFDEAHLPLYSIGSNPAAAVVGGYSEFAGTLTAAGYNVNTIDPGTVIDATVLSGGDILVIVVSQNAYTVPELDAIETWVGAGGSILLIPDRLGLGLMMEPLLARFGFDFADDILRDSDDGLGTGDDSQLFYDGPNILSHPITTGVSRVEMYAGDGLIAVPVDEIPIIITDTDGTGTWGDYTPALGVSVMSVVDDGSAGAGKVCVIGDCNLWDSAWDSDSDGEINFYDSDNENLALNTINWLAPLPSDSIIVTNPHSSSSWETGTTHSITWASTGSISDVKIELYENDVFVMEIVASTPNDGEFSWLIPTTLLDSTQYQIEITDVANPATDDLSDYFVIFTPVVDGQLFDGMLTNYTFTYRYGGEEYIGLSHFLYSQISGSIFQGNFWIYLEGFDYNNYYDVDSNTRIMTNHLGDIFFLEGQHDPGWIFTSTNLDDDIPIAMFYEEHIFNVIDDLIYDLPGYGLVEVWVLEDLTLPGGIAWYEKSTGILLNGTFLTGYGEEIVFDFINTNVEFTYYEPPSLTITIPDSTTSWETGTTQSITWTSTGSISDVKIELYKGDVLERVIIASTSNDNSFDWAIPTDLVDGTDYQIKISNVVNPTIDDISEYFEILTLVVGDTITVTNPDSTSVWEMGTSQDITWTSTGTISDVKIELYKDGDLERVIIASTTNGGSFDWTIPTDLDDGIDYQIRISDVSNPTTYNDSPYFTITSVDLPGDGAIPGYNLYILIGVISIVSIILLKNRKKF